MGPASSVRADNRLADVPMVPVACRTCGARLLVRKSSWNQTSVQWDAEATARCAERRDADRRAGRHGGLFLACSALWDSINAGVQAGELGIVDNG